MHRWLTTLILSLSVVILFMASYATALDTDGLVGAWLLDEGKGDTVTDASDNGLDGKISQGKPKWVNGKFGGAMEFGGAQVSPGTKPDTSDNLFFIGGCDIGNYWMSGSIDEVVLYDRALSEKEINELMEDGMSVALDVQPGGKLVTTWSQIKGQAAR